MAAVYGGFSLPQSNQSTITRFSSIREYILDANSLSGNSQVNITDIVAGSIIYRIDLIVMSAFSDLSGQQHSIEITDYNYNILMDAEWNDPNSVGTYCTNCYHTVLSGSNTIQVLHSLSEILSGTAILRLYIYNNVEEYTTLLTSDQKAYKTMDETSIDVRRAL